MAVSVWLLLMIVVAIPLCMAGVVSVIAQLCSGGDAKAESPTGPDSADSADHEELRRAAPMLFGIVLATLAFAGGMAVLKGLGVGPFGKGIGLLAFVAVAAVAWGTFALVRNGYGKWVVSGGALLAIGLALGSFSVVEVEGVTEDVNEALAEAVADLGDGVSNLRADVGAGISGFREEIATELNQASDELFDGGNARIRLADDAAAPSDDEQVAEEEASQDNSAAGDDGAIAIGKATEPLPDWVAAPPAADHAVLATEPFLSSRMAREDARQRVIAWLTAQGFADGAGVDHERLLDEATLAEAWERTVQREHTQRVATSVGDTFVLHVAVRADDDDRAWFTELVERHRSERQRRDGVLAVSLTGGGLLAGLAALYGVLSIGQTRKA